MIWGTYLARGVAGASDGAGKPGSERVSDGVTETVTLSEGVSEGVSECPVTPDQSRVDKVLKYVEEMFRRDGASAFSSKMAVGFLQVKLAAHPAKMARVVAYLLGRLNGKKHHALHPLQMGCPNIIPGLRAQPFWDTSCFPWVKQLEAAFPAILSEFLALRAKGPHFQPYRAPVSDKVESTDSSSDPRDSVDALGQLATDRGDWNVCYLFLHDMQCFESNREACPETVRAIKNIPHQYNHALFSALAPATHVSEHYGPTNKKLRCHLPLVVPTRDPGHPSTSPLCSLTVAKEERALEAGKCVIFDDSFLHEAENRAGLYHDSDCSTGPRVVLIIDVWHPDLSAEEVKFLGFLENAKMKAVRNFAAGVKKGEVPENPSENISNTFFDVIEGANGAAVTNENIWAT